MGALNYEGIEVVLFSPSLLLALLSKCVTPGGPSSPKDPSQQGGSRFGGVYGIHNFGNYLKKEKYKITN